METYPTIAGATIALACGLAFGARHPMPRSSGTHYVVVYDNEGQVTEPIVVFGRIVDLDQEREGPPITLISRQGSSQPISKRYYDIDLE